VRIIEGAHAEYRLYCSKDVSGMPLGQGHTYRDKRRRQEHQSQDCYGFHCGAIHFCGSANLDRYTAIVLGDGVECLHLSSMGAPLEGLGNVLTKVISFRSLSPLD
jgi:hypothetical protein